MQQQHAWRTDIAFGLSYTPVAAVAAAYGSHPTSLSAVGAGTEHIRKGTSKRFATWCVGAAVLSCCRLNAVGLSSSGQAACQLVGCVSSVLGPSKCLLSCCLHPVHCNPVACQGQLTMIIEGEFPWSTLSPKRSCHRFDIPRKSQFPPSDASFQQGLVHSTDSWH